MYQVNKGVSGEVFSLREIYSESLLAVCDAEWFSTMLVLLPLFPRNAALITYVPGETCAERPPGQFEHRLAPQFVFIGQFGPRWRHVVAGIDRYLVWSDDVRPTIGLYVPHTETRWEGVILDAMSPVWIHAVLGGIWRQEQQVFWIAFEAGNSMFFGSWEFDKHLKLTQRNFGVDRPKTGEFLALKLIESTLFVLCQRGLLEFCTTSGSALWRGCGTGLPPMLSFEDIGDCRVYVDVTGVMWLSRPNTIEYLAPETVPRASSIGFIRARLSGKVMGPYGGLQLHRCALCKAPLLVPLLTRTKDPFNALYCSRACERDHWPAYAVSMGWQLPSDSGGKTKTRVGAATPASRGTSVVAAAVSRVKKPAPARD
jgi:hypothetical protein